MPHDNVEQTVKELMVQRLYLKVKPEDIADDALIMETLGVDSVSVFEIVVGLEETFGLSFEDEEFRIENFRTPKSIEKRGATALPLPSPNGRRRAF